MAKRFDVTKAVQAAQGAASGAAGGDEDQAAPKPAPKTRTPRTPAGKDAAGAPAPKDTSKPAQTSRRTGAHLAAVPTEDKVVDEQILHGGEPAKLAKRVHVPLPEDLFRFLKRANAEDDIDTTVRIRAMIELYEHDERHRARVDKIAKKRNEELIRHRWG